MLDKKFFKLALFLFILFVFCYFRLKPIHFQTVPFTYDQGRDFLKAQEIIRDKNITFIGPTTGIQGLFHGVWWYYLLVIPYVLFNGDPIGFYFFIFLLNLVATVLFALFLERRFNYLTSLIFLSIAAISPYFISTSFFPINSIMTIPFILLLLFSTFEHLKLKNKKTIFLIFLSLGFIFEAEVPFGIFIIPAYICTIVVSKQLKKFFPDKTYFFAALAGLFIPLLPRLLFEIKNDLLQTHTILGFLTSPTSTNETSFQGLLTDRLRLFIGYYTSVFDQQNLFLPIVAFILSLIGNIIFFGKKSAAMLYRNFLVILIFLVFILTLVYKNNFFWGNYLEGFSYFFLTLLVIGMYYLSKSVNKLIMLLPVIFVGIYILYLGINFSSGFFKKENINSDGLIVHRQAVEYIYQNNTSSDVCVRIYTPPVIPFTYNYLFSYYSKIYKAQYPTQEASKNICWYIIEHDDNKERKSQWLMDNLPKEGKLLQKKQFNTNVTLELWKIK